MSFPKIRYTVFGQKPMDIGGRRNVRTAPASRLPIVLQYRYIENFESRNEDYMEFSPFRLEDRDFIDGFFGEHHYEQADCSFATLYLWQETYDTCWAADGDVLFIRAGRGENTFFMPPFAKSREGFSRGLALIREEAERAHRRFLIKSASPWVCEQIEKAAPGAYTFTPDRNTWEYIYRTDELLTLPGKKFRMKKNHLNGFLRQYPDYVYEPVTAETMGAVREALAEWFARHGHIEEEERAIGKLLSAWDALSARAGVIRIYGKVEAFTAGTLLNERIAHIFFEKANPEIRGLYQAINREFLLREFSETEFVNREEDLGLPGLRQAKTEYHPDHFAEKYDVVINSIF